MAGNKLKSLPIKECEEFIPLFQYKLSTMGYKTSGDIVNAGYDELYSKFENKLYFRSCRHVLHKLGLTIDGEYDNLNLPQELINVEITSLSLSLSIKRLLIKNEIFTLGELLTTEYNDILGFSFIEESQVNQIKDYIHSIGYSLKNERLSTKELKKALKEKGATLIEDSFSSEGLCSVLERAGIYTIEQLIAFGPEVFNLVGMGELRRKSLEYQMDILNIKFNENPDFTIKIKDHMLPSENTIKQLQESNRAIKKQMEEKESLLAEYNALVEQRIDLLMQDAALDEKIDNAIARLKALKKANHGRR